MKELGFTLGHIPTENGDKNICRPVRRRFSQSDRNADLIRFSFAEHQEHSGKMSFAGSFRLSPFGLLEELFLDDPWRVLLSAIMLNRTTRRQVDVVLCSFLQSWPNADSVAVASIEDLASVIRPLGMHVRRARGIVKFSKEYLTLLAGKTKQYKKATHTFPMASQEAQNFEISDAAFRFTRNEILGLFNCGQYAYDAYRIFVQHDLDFAPSDSALQAYIEYHHGVQKLYSKQQTMAPINLFR